MTRALHLGPKVAMCSSTRRFLLCRTEGPCCLYSTDIDCSVVHSGTAREVDTSQSLDPGKLAASTTAAHWSNQ